MDDPLFNETTTINYFDITRTDTTFTNNPFFNYYFLKGQDFINYSVIRPSINKINRNTTSEADDDRLSIF